jgi:hypothetical protein
MAALFFATLLEFALVAQWIEHRSPKAGVGGSIPLQGTKPQISLRIVYSMGAEASRPRRVVMRMSPRIATTNPAPIKM